MTIQEAIAHYLSARTIRGLSPMTVKTDRNLLRLFCRFLEAGRIYQVEGLTGEKIREFDEDLAFQLSKKGKLFGPSYRNRILASLVMFLKWIQQEDYTASDFSKGISLVKEPQKLPRNILTAKEVENVLKAPDSSTEMGFRDQVILELLYVTGIRSKEILGLRVHDADLPQGDLYIREGKGGKDRVVPLSQNLCELLEKYLFFIRPKFIIKGDEKNEFLFPSRKKKGRGLSRNTLIHLTSQYGKRMEGSKKTNPHAFRHACATHMLNQGAEIRYVQELLGHSSLNSTQVYTHVTINDLKKAHKKYHPREKMKLRDEPPK